MESSTFPLNSQLYLHFYSNHHQSKHALAVTDVKCHSKKN